MKAGKTQPAGTVIGKALGSLDNSKPALELETEREGVGVIEVLVMLK